jgi:hypothetical protein
MRGDRTQARHDPELAAQNATLVSAVALETQLILTGSLPPLQSDSVHPHVVNLSFVRAE